MTREQRLAANEITFRRVNEEIAQLEVGWGLRDLELVCECAQTSCTQVLTMTVEEYERLRQNPARFAVLPGHEIPDIEDVVEEHPAYLIVEKHADTRGQVEATDPRR